MPNVMAALPNIGGALCEGSIIRFLIPRCKVWLTPLLECRAVTLPISENARLGRKVNFARGEIPSGGKRARKCIYSVPGQETAKHRAKFGWPPINDVAAVTKARLETRWNFLRCRKLPNQSQPLVSRSSPYRGDTWRRYCCLIRFFSIVDTCLSSKDRAWQRFLRPLFPASRVQHMHSKFALRPHHV